MSLKRLVAVVLCLLFAFLLSCHPDPTEPVWNRGVVLESWNPSVWGLNLANMGLDAKGNLYLLIVNDCLYFNKSHWFRLVKIKPNGKVAWVVDKPFRTKNMTIYRFLVYPNGQTMIYTDMGTYAYDTCTGLSLLDDDTWWSYNAKGKLLYRKASFWNCDSVTAEMLTDGPQNPYFFIHPTRWWPGEDRDIPYTSGVVRIHSNGEQYEIIGIKETRQRGYSTHPGWHVDREGNILLSSQRGEFMTLQKFSPEGALIWETTVADAQLDEKEMYAIAADPSGGILVTTVAKKERKLTPTFLSFWKFDANGSFQWANTVDRQPVENRKVYCKNSFRLLPDGRIFCLSQKRQGSNYDLMIHAFDAQGHALWEDSLLEAQSGGLRTLIHEKYNTCSTDMTLEVDRNQRLCITLARERARDLRAVTWYYSFDGERLNTSQQETAWYRKVSPFRQLFIRIDEQGNRYFAGTVVLPRKENEKDYQVCVLALKYNAEGILEWERPFFGEKKKPEE